jgi:hypothetical protein
MGFTLRLPFRVAPGRTFAVGSFAAAGLDMELKASAPWHVLQVQGLTTEDAARALLPRLVAALVWLGLETRDGIEVISEPQDLVLRDNPAPATSIVAGAHGIGDEGRPAIYPDDRVARFAYVSPASVQVSTPLESFVGRLIAGLELPGIEAALKDRTVRLATEVFLSSYFEESPYAAFLARVTALEILKRQADHPPAVLGLVDNWIGQVRDLRKAGMIDERVAESLAGSLVRLKEESIGRAIQSLVASLLGPDRARVAADLYSLRSDLVHHGRVGREEIRRRLPELTDLVRDVLKGLLAAEDAAANR